MFAAFAVFAGGACGDRVVYRPLLLDVQNVSATADALIVKVIAGDDIGDRSCSEINLANVQAIETEYQGRWMRSDGSNNRQVDLPEIDADRALVVVYTEDSNGAAIQIACSAIEYSEIESGRIVLRLSMRMARIIPSWSTSSDRSSSTGSSVAVEWPKFFSRIATITIKKRSWS